MRRLHRSTSHFLLDNTHHDLLSSTWAALSLPQTPGGVKLSLWCFCHKFRARGVDVTLREFTAAEGADGHCQLNNLRLAHAVVFDWLDRVFGRDSGDMRLRC